MHIAAELVIYLPVNIVKLNVVCVKFHIVSKQVTAAGIEFNMRHKVRRSCSYL